MDGADKVFLLSGNDRDEVRWINFVDVSDDAVRDTLLGFGMDEWLVGAIVDLGAEYRRCGSGGYPAQVTKTVQKLAGRQARSLDQLLEESWPP